LVEIESPSDNKAAVDRVAEAVAERFSRLGDNVEVRFHRANDFGNHLQMNFQVNFGSKSAKPVLLLGHYDTVYPLGTLADMPCRVVGDKLTGPGVSRYEIGHRVDAARDWRFARVAWRVAPRPMIVLLVSDEEVWQRLVRAAYHGVAGEKAAAVLVL